MKKLSKKQRHEVYKKALSILLDEDSTKYIYWRNNCICHCIMNAKYKNLSSYSDDIFYSIFPEFNIFKPELEEVDEYESLSYWFDDRLQREIVLDLCIEMTK